MNSFADIILPLALPKQYTYSVAEELRKNISVGKRVIVQFGKKKYYSAIVYRVHNSPPEYPDIKKIISIIDELPVVTTLQLRFWEWIAEYYMCTLGEVYNAAVPSRLKLESETEVFFNTEYAGNLDLSDNETMVFNLLKSKQKLSLSEINTLLDIKNSFPVINSLLEKNIVTVDENLVNTFKPKTETYIRLSEKFSDKELLNDFAEKLKRARNQEKLLMDFLHISDFLNQTPSKEILKKQLIQTESAAQAMKALIKKEVFEEVFIEVGRLENNNGTQNQLNILNSDQQKVLDGIKNKFQNKDTVLLYGVTSSGKTEVYIHLINEIIKSGKQVLYLLPEIALTAQIINRLKNIFGNLVGVYHSRCSDSVRVEIWNSILGINKIHNYKIILGARSSVFLPFQDLGLIIIDEEHENSYKQFDPAPRYNARDSALVLAKLHNAKILLGTATPAIETYYNATSGKFEMEELSSRWKNIELPRIIIADIRESMRKKTMQSHFTPTLIRHMKEALEKNEQIILFQNRRGFSPYVQCDNCGWIPKCRTCNVSLTYHKYLNKLVCHYCGYTHKLFPKCPDCGSAEIFTKGFGTEKIEEEIAAVFPEARIARLDMDTSRTKKRYENIISDFEEGKTNILIGTQMVTKGLDFDNVSVVGILNADAMLNFPDFRAFERSFQLMTQVSGRAGRKHNQGKVVLQTSQPSHPVIQDILRDDFMNFYTDQITERKNFSYPPFCRLLKITVRHRQEEVLETAVNSLVSDLKRAFNEKILGPETPFVNKIQNYFLKNILVKLDKDKSLNQSKKLIFEKIAQLKQKDSFKNIEVMVDVDPM